MKMNLKKSNKNEKFKSAYVSVISIAVIGLFLTSKRVHLDIFE